MASNCSDNAATSIRGRLAIVKRDMARLKMVVMGSRVDVVGGEVIGAGDGSGFLHVGEAVSGLGTTLTLPEATRLRKYCYRGLYLIQYVT